MMDEPKLIGQCFEVLEPVGEGGMGKVFRGRDTLTGELVAIKALNAEGVRGDPTLVERFTREGEALRKLNHPNIVKILACSNTTPTKGKRIR